MSRLWEYTVRFRNWIVTIIGAAAIILPELLASPELLAVLPAEYHKWVFLGTLVLNLAMRWRPAVISTDLEASVSRSKKR